MSNNTRLDKNGKTEAQFLREYDVTQYFRPSVTTDAALYCRTAEHHGKVLLIRRGGHPYIGKWALPGGFVEKDEPCELTAPRELMEETGITGVPLSQLVTVSTPGRDPRWRNITVVYYALLDGVLSAKGGDDAENAEWFDVRYSLDGDAARLELASADGAIKFTSRLKICRDAFGKIDINNTQILEAGELAFDHSKVLSYLIEECK